MMNKAIFLDKDGTLIENLPYNVDPKKIRLYADVPEALVQFKSYGFMIIIITNQPGVAFGYFEEDKLTEVENAIADILKKSHVSLDGFYYCPHHREGTVKKFSIDCSCRKPMPGMIVQAAKDLNIDLTESWMIGDILNDVEAGKRAGCKTILLDNGNETEWIVNHLRIPTFIVKNMKEAAKKIIGKGAHYEERKKV